MFLFFPLGENKKHENNAHISGNQSQTANFKYVKKINRLNSGHRHLR